MSTSSVLNTQLVLLKCSVRTSWRSLSCVDGFSTLRLIDRTCNLKAELPSESRPPDAHCRRVGLAGHLIRASTACPLGIQSGPDKGVGNGSAEVSSYNVSYALFVLAKGTLAPLPSIRANKERAWCATRLPLGADLTC